MPESIKYYKEKIKKLGNQVRKLKNELNARIKAWSKTQEGLLATIEELRLRTEELEKFEKFTIGRELRMMELKKRIKELEEKEHGD